MTLDGTPLPGGLYAQSPAGTKVTLKTLAERMIAVSHNSATDVLLATPGRERIEAMLPVVGIAKPEGMRPFLGTLEVFKLKGVDGGALGRRWAKADERGRRALLAGWSYVGYKGGSEPGVIAITFLLQAKDGAWYALSGSWNDPAAAVDDARFAALMARAVELAATR